MYPGRYVVDSVYTKDGEPILSASNRPAAQHSRHVRRQGRSHLHGKDAEDVPRHRRGRQRIQQPALRGG